MGLQTQYEGLDPCLTFISTNMKTPLASQTYAFVVGTDVSKESLDVCLIRVADKQLCYQKFNNNMQGFQKMKQWLKSYGCELERDTLFCMEHTGLYTRRLVHYLMSRAVAVWLETPLQIKRSIGLARGKDDKIDSERIARYALLHQDKAILVNLSGLTIEKLKDLQANRNRLLKALKSIKTTVKEMLSVDTASGKTLQQVNKEAIKGLEKSLEQVEEKMSEFIESDEELKKKYDLMTSIKGVGKVLAITLLVYTHGFSKMEDGGSVKQTVSVVIVRLLECGKLSSSFPCFNSYAFCTYACRRWALSLSSNII